jgi:acyl-CoA synthetase (AMP-forming)/AMP-acid ligase II
MAFNIADLFEHAADAVPDRTAIVVGDLRRTYRELDERATRFAHHLASKGIGHGDHVGIYGVNSEPWVVAMLAAFKLRAVPINVNFRYVADELTYLFTNADLVALVHDRGYSARIAEVRGAVPLLRHFVAIEDGSDADLAGLPAVDFEAAVAEGAPERDFTGRTGDDLYVLYTGGTTGMPKGVMWRQEDVFYALGGGVDAYSGELVTSEHALAEKALASEAPMVTLCCPPLMHGAAQWGTLRFLFEGNTVVFVAKFDPEALWDAVEAAGVNTISLTGDAMARPLIETLEANPGRWDTSSVFVVSSSAAVFSPSVKERFLECFPTLLLVDAIGSTETGHNGMAVVSGSEPAAARQVHKEGIGVTVKGLADSVVLDEDLRPVIPGSGVVGRLARGGNVPLGYYKDEEKTKATFVTAADGRRYAMPGDWATVEADGNITLLGRGSVSINSGGEKVFPEEVEGSLKEHAAVYDAVVIGIPDERWGQAVAAIVQLRPGAETPSLEELAEHCRARIARYKVPRRLAVVDEVRRSPSGKPDYPWAKALLAERLGS